MLHILRPTENATTAQPTTKVVTGHYLIHNPLNARGRAQLAADAIAGRVTIDTSTLTVGQVIKLCRANKTYVNEIHFPDRVKRRQRKKFAAVFDAIGPEARMEACRTVGLERVWNALTAAL